MLQRSATVAPPPGVEILRALRPEWSGVMTPAALEFVAQLHRAFDARRHELLDRRQSVQRRLDAGEPLDFLRETLSVRFEDWTCAPVPAELLDRRVEITGPIDRKMIINALNSGANVFMADFEDSSSPTWENMVDGQANLFDAVRRTIEYTAPDTGKHYALGDDPAVLFVRPRGWHLDEAHVRVDGAPVSGSLFDFGLYFFHNAHELLARGTAPYFYLPKLESHLEARLWNDVFVMAQNLLGVPRGTVKATVLIETIPAAFEMDEILFELREHSAGLNCGRWDYIFSFIKKFRRRADFVLPDRGAVGMTQPFLHAYSQLLIRTCHRRGVHAMGGMAAQIPIKGDPAANEAALAKVRADKEREARDGHDGTWVAHPALVSIAREVFDAHVEGPNQLHVTRDDVQVGAADLLRVPAGPITEAGLRQNVSVGIQYLAAWLRGSGCVPLYHLMEDAATAEISRAQVWQWLKHHARLDDGRPVDLRLVETVLEGEMNSIRDEVGAEVFAGGKYDRARALFEQMLTALEFPEFLTLSAYRELDHT